MSKTVNTVNVGDQIYHPIVDEIEEIPISEIRKTSEGILIGTKTYGLKINDSSSNAAISREVKFESYKSGRYFLNIEDAKKYQKHLQERRLKYLQEEANKALQTLNEFTLKYFTNENNH